MSDLTTYRIDWITFKERYPHEFAIAAQSDVIRTDARLQAIADAWGPSSDSQSDCRYDLPELAALLDALNE